MGWYVIEDCQLGRVVAHGGGYPGYGSYVALLPDKRVGMFAFSNRTYGPISAPVWACGASTAPAPGVLLEPLSLPGSDRAQRSSCIVTTGDVWRRGGIDPARASWLAMNFLMDRSDRELGARAGAAQGRSRRSARRTHPIDRHRRARGIVRPGPATAGRMRRPAAACSDQPADASRRCSSWSSRAAVTWPATILTLYPEMFPGPLGHSLAGRALSGGGLVARHGPDSRFRDRQAPLRRRHAGGRRSGDGDAGGRARRRRRSRAGAAPGRPAAGHVAARRAAHAGPRPHAGRRSRRLDPVRPFRGHRRAAVRGPPGSSRSRSATMCCRAASPPPSPCSTLAFGCFPA